MSAVTLETMRADFEAAKNAIVSAVEASINEHAAMSGGHVPFVAFNWLLEAKRWTADDFANQTFRKKRDHLQKAVVLAAKRYVEARDGALDPQGAA